MRSECQKRYGRSERFRSERSLVPVLKMRNPESVKICTILSKPSRRKADIEPDYCGFEVPDEFVVGYGLDYDEKYRTLPYVGVLKPEVYSD